MAMLVESGVQSLSGVQNYPTLEMWEDIDPTSQYQEQWIRMGHIEWTFGIGQTVVANPQPDVIAVTLDPCSTFAQEHVSYVLADAAAPVSECLVQTSQINQENLHMRIYEITP